MIDSSSVDVRYQGFFDCELAACLRWVSSRSGV
jgi:hypothetical protein